LLPPPLISLLFPYTTLFRSNPLPSLNLILALPLIAFFLLVIRNVIGLETFGTFSPMLLSLAFLTTGLGWGLVVFLIIVGLGSGLDRERRPLDSSHLTTLSSG